MGVELDGVDAVKGGLVAFCFPGQGSLDAGILVLRVDLRPPEAQNQA